MELLLVLVIALAALFALGVNRRSVGARSAPLALAALTVAGLAASAWAWYARPISAGGERDPLTAERPLVTRSDGYVSSTACRACHPQEYATWQKSFHRTMTQVVTPNTLVSNWDGVTLTHRGKDYHLSRKGEQFWVDMVDPEWDPGSLFGGKPRASGNMTRRVQKRVVMSTGSHHQQVYWITAGEGRKVHLFQFTWLIVEQRWVPYENTFLNADVEHEQTEVWNASCVLCHATHGKMRPARGSNRRFDTHVAEFGIACEACHGPGENHVARHSEPIARYAARSDGEPDPTIVNPVNLTGDVSSHACAQCHSIFEPKGRELAARVSTEGMVYRPGDDLRDTRNFFIRSSDPDEVTAETPAVRRALDQSFWRDGMLRVAGRDFHGLEASPCFEGGEFTCFSCHSMHSYEDASDQLAPGMDGDEACLQCHEDMRKRITEHTHHATGSGGSACMNCHMPYTTYGLLTAIRSHTISVPNVRESQTHERPNACNLCHLDQSLEWTREHLTEWFDTPQDAIVATEDKQRSAALVWLLRGNAGQRALTAWAAGWKPAHEASGTDWQAPFLGYALEDPYAAVRFIAHRSLRSLPGYGDFEYGYVDPPAERSATAQRAREQWNAVPSRGSPTLLLDQDGTLDSDAILDVIRRRDERHMFLAE